MNCASSPISDGLCREAAERILRAGQKAVADEGRFALLLSGGQTPRRLYALLGSAEYNDRLDWSRTHLFWGDERAVPLSDLQSNYRMVAETLLSRVVIPEDHIHRIRTELPSEEAAASYERELRGFFAGPPRFHVALLGMGTDGHTASLFPGSPALREQKRLVVATAKGSIGRISLTLAALNATREVLFLLTGGGARRQCWQRHWKALWIPNCRRRWCGLRQARSCGWWTGPRPPFYNNNPSNYEKNLC